MTVKLHGERIPMQQEVKFICVQMDIRLTYIGCPRIITRFYPLVISLFFKAWFSHFFF